MKDILNRLDDASRRDFVRYLSSSLLGVTTASFLGCNGDPSSAAVDASGEVDLTNPADLADTITKARQNPRPTAKSVIYLYMSGGMTHLDTFDPKPDAGKDFLGQTEAIKTSVTGTRLGHWFEKSAKHMDKMAVINSMFTSQGAHGPGNYFMHTSYAQRASIKHPRIGSWINKLSGGLNPDLPASVFIGSNSVGGGAGFLASRYGSLGVGDPDIGLKNAERPTGISENDFRKRLDLASFLDTEFHSKYELKEVEAYTDMYTDALRMMNSEDIKGFNLNDESEDSQALYGDTKFGRGCLLARRLVEHGVRFVEVSLGGWDMHNNLFDSLPEKMASLDQGLSALLQDLDLRGMLDETMVVVATEFGRTPKLVYPQAGRNHYPKAFSCMLAGGGIAGGQVYGKTDKNGENVIENRVKVPDFNATIAHALGLPYNEIVYSPSKRPFTVADTGDPVLSLFG